MNLRSAVYCLLFALPLMAGAASPNAPTNWYGAPEFPEGYPWSFQILSSDASGTRMLLECPGFWAQPVLQSGEMRTKVILPDAGLTTDAGLPELPAICRLLAIPDDRDPEVIIHGVSYQVFSCENPYLADPIAGTAAGLASRSIPEGIFPRNWADAQAPAILKDHRVAPVNIYPIRYDEAEGQLLLATRLEFELRTQKPSAVNVKTHHARTSEAFAPIYQSAIDNFSGFNTAAPLVGEDPRGGYLIFINDAYQSDDSLTAFANWKRQLGYQVTIKPISSLSVTKEEIKAAIFEEYYGGDVPLDYVLLIGDETGQGSITIPSYRKIKPGGSEQDVTDHPYSLLEGQDYFPDIMVGRISVTSALELRKALHKTMIYQRDPYVTNPAWFKKGLVVAGNHADSGPDPITPVWTSLWLVDKLYEHGYSQVDTFFYWGLGSSLPDPAQIEASINTGVGLVAYRGWADAEGWTYPEFKINNVNALNNGPQLPIVVSMVCNTGDFGNTSYNPCFGEAWLRTGSLYNLSGGAAFFGPSDLYTNTKWNNALYAGFFEGLLEENLYRIGQAATRSKLELYYGFPENTGIGGFAEFYFHVYNILGDPELPIWTDIPADITLEIPGQLPPGRQVVTATVKDGAGSPLGGVYVAFYKEDEVLAGGVSSGYGTISVEIEPLSEGTIIVTASKQNCIPEQAAISVQLGDFPLGISDLSVDGDGIASAGETVDLAVTLHNYGSDPLSGVHAELSESDPHIAVLQPTVSLGYVSASGDAVASFSLDISSACPGGHMVEFTLALSDDASHSSDAKFLLSVGGLQFLPDGFYAESGSLDPGDTAQIRLRLLNMGSVAAQNLAGTLSCSNSAVAITTGPSSFPALPPGTAGVSLSTFTVEVDPSAAVGRQVILDLEVSASGGFAQTIRFPAQLGSPASSDPLGPDSYGYYAYDDTDVGYSEAPSFSWIELDPDYGGNFDSYYPMGDDVSVPVELPFPFTFYGIEYDSLTICSNGWVSLGETWMANFRNWNLPSALGPPALVAPFWDDLKADTSGGNSSIHVYTRYDASEGRFVVEWSRCINRYGYETPSTWKEETFELILFDPDTMHHPTVTGDGEILFQYLVVHDIDDNNNYATVGIEDEGHQRGLQYAYSDDYPSSAAILDSGRSIKFTTDPPDAFGQTGGGYTGAGVGLRFYAPVPNPANPAATLRFAVPRSGRAVLALYNTLGRRVATLLDGEIGAGLHCIEIGGDRLSSGIYFAALRFEGSVLTQKILFLK